MVLSPRAGRLVQVPTGTVTLVTTVVRFVFLRYYAPWGEPTVFRLRARI